MNRSNKNAGAFNYFFKDGCSDPPSLISNINECEEPIFHGLDFDNMQNELEGCQNELNDNFFFKDGGKINKSENNYQNNELKQYGGKINKPENNYRNNELKQYGEKINKTENKYEQNIINLDENDEMMYKELLENLNGPTKKKRIFVCSTCDYYKNLISKIEKSHKYETNKLYKKFEQIINERNYYKRICCNSDAKLLDKAIQENEMLKEKINYYRNSDNIMKNIVEENKQLKEKLDHLMNTGILIQKLANSEKYKKGNLQVQNIYNFKIGCDKNKQKQEIINEIKNQEIINEIIEVNNAVLNKMKIYKKKKIKYQKAFRFLLLQKIDEYENITIQKTNNFEITKENEIYGNEDENDVMWEHITEKSNESKDPSLYSIETYEVIGKKRKKIKKYVDVYELNNFDIH